VFQMINEVPQPAASHAAMEGIRFMQCRLPTAQYEWLRSRAFHQSASMNSIVLQAIESLQETAGDTAGPLELPSAPGASGSMSVNNGRSGGVKFNVRLSNEMYEWLRAKAFHSRASINQLTIAALADLRLREEGLS
jgi:predicted HicB family RNase H-like nuclease